MDHRPPGGPLPCWAAAAPAALAFPQPGAPDRRAAAELPRRAAGLLAGLARLAAQLLDWRGEPPQEPFRGWAGGRCWPPSSQWTAVSPRELSRAPTAPIRSHGAGRSGSDRNRYAPCAPRRSRAFPRRRLPTRSPANPRWRHPEPEWWSWPPASSAPEAGDEKNLPGTRHRPDYTAADTVGPAKTNPEMARGSAAGQSPSIAPVPAAATRGSSQ